MKKEDVKVLSVPASDSRFDGSHDITDAHPQKLREIQEFFETYKRLKPHKRVRFKEWKKCQRNDWNSNSGHGNI